MATASRGAHKGGVVEERKQIRPALSIDLVVQEGKVSVRSVSVTDMPGGWTGGMVLCLEAARMCHLEAMKLERQHAPRVQLADRMPKLV